MTNSAKPHLFVTNDDGAASPAFRALIAALRPHYTLMVAIPSSPRSGIAKAISFEKPIRVLEGRTIEGQPIKEISGTPADAITWCRTYCRDIRMVVSGLNLGLNVSLHSMYTSGTVGAAFEAALWRIPAIAFSIETPSHNWFIPGEIDANVTEAAHRAKRLIDYTIAKGLPPGVDFLNVNFPEGLTASTPTRVANCARIRFINRFKKRLDPNGNPYFWITGNPVRRIHRESDVYASTKALEVVITPVNIALSDKQLVKSTHQFLQPILKGD